ncbi:family 16 glycosylhydrolase [Paracoccus sp. R86501]|uniref:family 16 glycosylhydrolase n=1 Tax=Paracoccus sp. R86501 TaxID=3101711 RepID=UPI003672ABB6
MNQTEADQGLAIYTLGQQRPEDGWLVSDWGAGQTTIMDWSRDNVRTTADGQVQLVLDRAPDGSARPWDGGEIQNTTSATTGTWSWTAQAPQMVSGAVFGMFTYKSDWQNAPWTEFDFEFVGEDTTRVELNIHMIDVNGNHVSLADNTANHTIIDLGFDAADAAHTYEVSVTDTGAVFYIDGKIVGDFTAADMPGGTWNLAPMNSYVDLWAVPNSMQGWAGTWSDPGRPLVATVWDAEIRDGEYGSTYVPATDPVVNTPDEVAPPDATIAGSDDDDTLVSTADGDRMYGMLGDDVYLVDDANDKTFENPGEGHDLVISSVDWVLADNVEALSLQGKLHIDGIGNDLDNLLTGSGGRNVLAGMAGNDILDGQGGQDVLVAGTGRDTLIGGRGSDAMFGGQDQDRDTFVFDEYKESRTGSGHDVVHDFVSGIDKLDFAQFDADLGQSGKQDLTFAGSSAGAHSVWIVDAGDDLLLQADVDGDAKADFEVLIRDVAALSVDDFIF